MSDAIRSEFDYYGRVPENLLYAEGVSGDECRLYAIMTTFDYGRRRDIIEGRDELAAVAGWTVSKIDRVLRALQSRGAIRRVRRGRGHPNHIELRADRRPDESSDLSSHAPMSAQIRTDDCSPGETRPSSTNREIDAHLRIVDEPADSGFDAWWKEYPRRIDKARARKVFIARRAEGATVAALSAARDNYAASVLDTEARYIKHPATFLAKDGPWTEWLAAEGPDGPHEDPGTIAAQLARQSWGPKGEPNVRATGTRAATR